MTTIVATDFAISAGGAITSVAGSTVYSTLDLHQWLQDLADNPAPTADDNVSILGANPSELAGKRNALRPAALTLLNGISLNDACSQRFNFGSIEQLAGAELYTGINTIGSGLAGRSHYVVQNSAKYNSGTKWWAAGPVRALFKVKAAAMTPAANYTTLTVFVREWGYTFSHFDVDCSAGSEQVAALAVATDSNIGARVIGNYTFGTNTVTIASPASVVTLTPGTVSRTLGAVTKNYKGIISFTNAVRLSEVYPALQALCSETSTGTIGGVAGWQYRKLDAAYTENQAAPFGTLAGGKWLVAQGWWLDITSLNSLDLQAYQLVADDGTSVTPPNVISVSAGNLISGDYVIVGKDNGTTFNTTTGITTTGTAGASTCTLSGAPASDVPLANGYIRINGNPHTYTSITGTAVAGLSPVVPAGGYSASATWFPYLDLEVSNTSKSSPTFNWSADFTARVRVRHGASPSIVPFETTFPVTSAGGSVTAIRNADE